MCNEIFSYVEKNEGGKRVRVRNWFPAGCADCTNEDQEVCETGCLWPRNRGKYTEVKWLYGVFQAQKGGFPVTEIDSLDIVDFMKLGILKEYDRAMYPSMN